MRLILNHSLISEQEKRASDAKKDLCILFKKKFYKNLQNA